MKIVEMKAGDMHFYNRRCSQVRLEVTRLKYGEHMAGERKFLVNFESGLISPSTNMKKLSVKESSPSSVSNNLPRIFL